MGYIVFDNRDFLYTVIVYSGVFRYGEHSDIQFNILLFNN